ncbi:MAG: polysaccharide biosynthesis tyrosine autokinase [Desulfobacterales bacterium]|nr:polysaccharide biosynthesis tyrosine autokinase [Desulfobacterales bacterium]
MEKGGKEQVDLRDYLRVIIKRKWTVAVVFAVVVITVTIHAFTATPIYEATTRLIIDKENPNVVSIQEVMAVDTSGSDYYQTQYRIMESRAVAREVIKRLHLNESEEFFPKPKNSFMSALKHSLLDAVSFWMDSIASLLKTENKGTPEALEEHGPSSALVSRFVGRISVKPIRSSRLVDVSFQAKDPALAAKIADTIAHAYVDQNLDTRLTAVKNAVKWLHNRIEEERKRVENSEQALLRYKELHHIITEFSSDTEKITAQKLAQLNAKVVEAGSKRVEAETRYKQAMAMEATPDMLDSIPEVLNNELIRQIKAMEVELYKRMSELSKKYGRKHPRMVAANSELKTIQKRKTQEVNRVINSLKNEYRVALAREESLKAALAAQKEESLELNQKAIQHGALKREAESARHMYELLIRRFKETTLTEDMRTGNIRVIDRAEAPKEPVKPNKRLNILLAVIFSLFAGTGLAFFFEYLDNTIKSPEDIKRHLNIPYLGLVPAIAVESNGNYGGEIKPNLVTLHSPKSVASEAYRGIRTGILFSSAETEPRVILVSSVGPQEGKSITATNLAITMAQSGSRVILLDCDMRRPDIHKAFELSRKKGMSNILVGGCTIKDAVAHTRVTRLDAIPCGPIPPNPSELLGSARMAKLLEVLQKHYRRVIIDSPPITAVTDAAVLAKSVDGVVLVVRAGETPTQIVQNGLSHLQSFNARILGAVLNGVNIGRDSYYYYYYYGENGKRKGKA